MSAGAREPSGYLHRSYAASFAALATPRELPRCGGWILEREIEDSVLRDAMGCYPLFACHDWRALPADLDEASADLVSLALVADPFGNHDESILRRSFDTARPYKEHYVTDLRRASARDLPRRHRRNVARSRERVRVEICAEPARHLDEWTALYAKLAERHAITGLRAFSRDAFARQLKVAGLLMLRASADGDLAGIHLWYVQGDVAYGHLGATNELGYELMASYALYDFAIEHLGERVGWLELGAGAGIAVPGAGDGLDAFKRGWATETKTAYLCSRVFQPDEYQRLAERAGTSEADYFPAYRTGEFGGGREVAGEPAAPGR